MGTTFAVFISYGTGMCAAIGNSLRDLASEAASIVSFIASQAQRHFPRVQSSVSFFLGGEYTVGHKDDFRFREMGVRAEEAGTDRV